MSTSKLETWKKNESVTLIMWNVLKALARYRFLIPSQMLSLWVGTTEITYLWKQLQAMRERPEPFVRCTNYQHDFKPKVGRKEALYSLAAAWVRELVEMFDMEYAEIKHPKRKAIPYEKYREYIFMSDIFMAFDRWVDGKDDGEITYMKSRQDKTGNNRVLKNLRSQTKIQITERKHFIPDGIIRLSVNGVEELFLLEMCNGSDAGYYMKKLNKHGHAFTANAPQKALWFPTKPYRMVFICEKEWLINSLIERASKKKKFDHIQEHYIFKTLADIKEWDLFTGWRTLHGDSADLINGLEVINWDE